MLWTQWFKPLLRHAGLTLILTVVLVGEILSPQAAEDQPVVTPLPTSHRPIAQSPRPLPSVEAQSVTVDARPLFAKSRRPASPAVAALPPPPPPLVLPRLTGIVIGPGVRRALLASPGGKVVAVANGASVQGFVVAAIEQDRIVLSGPDGARTLRTRYPAVKPHVIHAQQEALAQP